MAYDKLTLMTSPLSGDVYLGTPSTTRPGQMNSSRRRFTKQVRRAATESLLAEINDDNPLALTGFNLTSQSDKHIILMSAKVTDDQESQIKTYIENLLKSESDTKE